MALGLGLAPGPSLSFAPNHCVCRPRESVWHVCAHVAHCQAFVLVGVSARVAVDLRLSVHLSARLSAARLRTCVSGHFGRLPVLVCLSVCLSTRSPVCLHVCSWPCSPLEVVCLSVCRCLCAALRLFCPGPPVLQVFAYQCQRLLCLSVLVICLCKQRRKAEPAAAPAISEIGAEPTQWNLVTHWVLWPRSRGKGQGRGLDTPLSFPALLVTHCVLFLPRAGLGPRAGDRAAPGNLPGRPPAFPRAGDLGLPGDSVLPHGGL